MIQQSLTLAILILLSSPLLFLLAVLYARSYISTTALVIISMVVAALILAVPLTADAYEFKFKGGYVVKASDYTTAARLCFSGLTMGQYQGEERSLEIIDVCANPTMPKDYKW